MSKKYDLSKATFIHTHPNVKKGSIYLINPLDLISFFKLCKEYNINKFEISVIDKNLKEHRRIFIKFTDKTIEYVKNNKLKDIIEEVDTADKLNFSKFSAGYMDYFLNKTGIIIREINIK